MALSKNIVANYAGALISAASPVVALPFYLASLGTAKWGLVSFATTLATLVSLLEVGLSQRLVRDLTLQRHRDATRLWSVLRGVAAYYWALAVVGALALLAASGWLVDLWLKVPEELRHEGKVTVYFAAVLVLTQIPNSAYRSILLASDRHLALNVQVGLFAVLKHVIGVGVAVVTEDLMALYFSYAVVATVELVVRRTVAARGFASSARQLGIDWHGAHEILRPAGKLALAVIAGILTLQIDRIYLSRWGSLHDLGVYSVALSIAYGVLQLTTPLVVSLAPTLALASTDPARLHSLCQKLLRGVVLLLAAGAVSYFLVGEWLVRLWLRDDGTFDEMRVVLRLLLVGTGLNLLYQVSYQRWIVLGQIRNVYVVNVSSLLLGLIVTPMLISAWGPLGAACSWILINGIGLIMNYNWMFRRE